MICNNALHDRPQVNAAQGASISAQNSEEESHVGIHKYKVGQSVRYAPGRSVMVASSREYKIVKLLPADSGENQYRIKGVAETFERMARESDLSQSK